MRAWHGHDPRRKPGLVLGHEFVGRIAETAAPGFETDTRWTDTRWTGNPLITSGVCEYGVHGRNNLCANRTMVLPLRECRVLVIGGGALGMLATLMYRRLGVTRLTVTSSALGAAKR